jgi:hypothetical protein
VQLKAPWHGDRCLPGAECGTEYCRWTLEISGINIEDMDVIDSITKNPFLMSPDKSGKSLTEDGSLKENPSAPRGVEPAGILNTTERPPDVERRTPVNAERRTVNAERRADRDHAISAAAQDARR